ncbi:phosphoadenosine phosphosulfate reductase domain-containing protein [Dysgonomonas macrotermitis]|uniref:Phosphoadenosine phosphosulfate reductase family protein n=1 Tax=Dysgonomonas macrotermitis TaxID=1346286 RepID=A0A1M4UNF0_9BACT|nr:phosphoadenosine phosphosulfate reductase family protein [Dysgonomonas macrotermitis]SHE58249.1 Phosphoadenosine phosphosulfate reductase family protein [Dysgonomonas macrotermitis]
MIPLKAGIKFRALWKGHENRIYQIRSVYKDYETKPHVHIKADLVDCPHEKQYSSGFWFTIYEDTLTDINNPENKIELLEIKGVQCTLFKNMKLLITCSGGKDSVAALLWMKNNGYKNADIVFCDTNWESDLTYSYIKYLEEKTGHKFIFLKSKKYDGLIDLAEKKGRFPSSQRRFCTSELKSIPMIDYILDEVRDDFIVVQGIRASESENRSKMESQCNYFKYYLEPIETNTSRLEKLEKYIDGLKSNIDHQLELFPDDEIEGSKDDKIIAIQEKIDHLKSRLAKGKEDPKYHTYRRKEVLAYCKKYATDVLRPVFRWTSQEVIDYALDCMIDVNPLYKMDMKI